MINKMKYINFFLAAFILFSSALLAFDKNDFKEIKCKYFIFNNKEIFLFQNDFQIKDENISIKKSIEGKKDFIVSDNSNYLLLINYGFLKSKENYSVTLFLFNRKLDLILEKEFKANFDLPHPIFSVNNNGLISSFNPIDFSLEIISENTSKLIKLKKVENLILERKSFLIPSSENIFVAATKEQMNFESSTPNVLLFSVDLNNSRITEKEIDLSTIISFQLIDDKIFLSGIKSNGMISTDELTYIFDIKLNQQKKINSTFSFSLKNENQYLSFYQNKISAFNYLNNKVNTNSIDNSQRIISLIEHQKKFYILSQTSSSIDVYKLKSTELIELEKIQSFGNKDYIFKVLINDGKVFMYSFEKTYLISF